jgi:hypothetical protein
MVASGFLRPRFNDQDRPYPVPTIALAPHVMDLSTDKRKRIVINPFYLSLLMGINQLVDALHSAKTSSALVLCRKFPVTQNSFPDGILLIK